jgi:hypothetical protein
MSTDQGESNTAIPVYRIAIDLTLNVIVERSKNFRNQVISIVFISLCSAIAAAITYLPWPLTCLLVAGPVCGLFMLFDVRLLSDWRYEVLSMWSLRDIDRMAFSYAVRAVPSLPEATLNSMLSLLGKSQLASVEVNATVKTRQTVAAVIGLSDMLVLRQLATKVGASAIITGSVIWSVASQSWVPLGLISTVLLLPFVFRWIKWSLLLQSKAVVMEAKQHPDFDANTFRSLMEQLPLEGGVLLADIWTNLEPVESIGS